MDLDNDDLAVLSAGLTTDEVDRVHRLLHERSVGPDGSFPVQLALLTKARWRIVANLPRLMNDARKLIEQHLAEYRRQSQAMSTFTLCGVTRPRDVAELLLASKAKVNAKTKAGATPLHWSVGKGRKEVVEWLLASGTDVNAKDNLGDIPLQWAADDRWGAAEMLFQDGFTPFAAPGRKDVAELLRQHGWSRIN